MSFPKFLRIAQLSKEITTQVNATTSIKELVFDEARRRLAQLLSEKLGFDYKLVTPSDGEIGRLLPNGTWTGLMGMLIKDEADLAFGLLSITHQRKEFVDFTYPYYIPRITFATRQPEYFPDMTTFLKPFSPEIWLFLATCFVVMLFAFFFIFRKEHPLRKLSLYLYSTLLNQSIEIRPRKVQDYIMIAFWVAAVMFLSYSYTAVLLSFMTFPPKDGVRTVAELAAAVESGKYDCEVLPGTYLIHVLSTSSDRNTKIIGQNVLKDKGTKDIDGFLRSKERSVYPAFVAGEDVLLPFKTRHFVSDDQFIPAMRSIAIQKHFCCKSQLNRVISYIWASGMHYQFVEESGFRKSLSYLYDSADADSGAAKSLTLEDLKGIFVFISAGYVLAISVFLIEITLGKIFNKDAR